LNNFIEGTKSELIGKEFNKSRPNLPKDEENAIKTREIVRKLCDKGAGIIICDFKDYKKLF
jgi:hypothetical protein